MSERSIQSITSIRPPETNAYIKISLPDKEDLGIGRESSSTDTTQLAEKTKLRNDFTKKLSNIAIHFNVDDETNRLVVVVTERNSGRVLRTIPASELEKMQAGDLLKLTA